MTQEEFIEVAFKKLKKQQDGFTLKFKLDSYDAWSYEQAIGVFTFSDDKGEKELNFKFKNVGTYSKKSNTWLWSWANEHTMEYVKLDQSIVKLGKEKGYQKLSTPQWEAEEYDGWEMMAATNHVLKALGGYCVPGDEEEPTMFLIFTGLISKTEADRLRGKIVECDVHEKGRAAYVCQHLKKEQKTGFHEAFDTTEGMELEEDEDFQGWCDLCEKEWQKAQEWNEENMKFAKVRMVCEACYFEIKKSNV